MRLTTDQLATLRSYRQRFYKNLSQRAFARKLMERSRSAKSDVCGFFNYHTESAVYALVRRLDGRGVLAR